MTTAAEEHVARIGSLRTCGRSAAAAGATLPRRNWPYPPGEHPQDDAPVVFRSYSPAFACRRPRETAACRRGGGAFVHPDARQTGRSGRTRRIFSAEKHEQGRWLWVQISFLFSSFWYHMTSLAFLVALYYSPLQILARLVYMSRQFRYGTLQHVKPRKQKLLLI